MADRAIKPTKRELIRSLAEAYRAQARQMAQAESDKVGNLRARLHEIEAEIYDLYKAVPDPPEVGSILSKLKSLGFEARAERVGRIDQELCIRASSTSIKLKPTAEITKLRAERDKLAGEIDRAPHRQRAYQYDDLAEIIENLPSAATPHLEALQQMVQDLLHSHENK